MILRLQNGWLLNASKMTFALMIWLFLVTPCVSTALGLEGAVMRPPNTVGPPKPDTTVNLPKIEVMLTKPVYAFHLDPKTGAPEMPNDVTAIARTASWPLLDLPPTSFTWQVFLDWDFPALPTHHSIRFKAFTHPSPFHIDFGNEIRGGTLRVIARTQWNGHQLFGEAHAKIMGVNPPRSLVLKAFPRSRFGLIASKIGAAESGLKQFGGDGMPSLSRTNDLGLMQLNAPSGSITSADQIWDWRANVRRGVDMLYGKRQMTVLASRHAVDSRRGVEVTDPNFEALGYLNCARLILGFTALPMPNPPVLSEKPGSGVVAGDPDPDHLGLSQIEREEIRRYNGGREYYFRFVPDPVTLNIKPAGWEVDVTRGGVRVKAGDPDYVRHVLNARSGFKLPEPPKPSKKKFRHRRHHRSH